MTNRAIPWLLTVAAGIPTLAGGFSTPIIGGRMIGRLAFAATADDTTAIFHNPAGLTQWKGYRVDTSVLSLYSHTIYRVERPDGSYSEGITFEKPYGYLPFVGFSGDLGTERWRFGIALYSPHNTAASLPPDSEARFQLIEGRIVTLFVTPTVAYQATDTLSVAAGVSAVAASASLKRWADFEPSLQIPVTALIDIQGTDTGYGWDAGALWKPSPRLALGLVYQSEVQLDFEGGLKGSNPAIDLAARSDIHVGFTLPQAVRVGVSFRPKPRWDIGADLFWQDYSVYKALAVDVSHLKASIGGSPLVLPDTSIVEPKDARDVIGGALGVTWRLSERWQASAGYVFDPSPYPDKTYTILSPDADKQGVAVGAQCAWKRVVLNGAYLRMQYEDRDVHDSILKPPANGSVHGKFNNALALEISYLF